MTAGLPDFYHGIDITYQSLGEIINRPKYGGAGMLIGLQTVPIDQDTFIASVIGKGMIYGGIMRTSPTETQNLSVPILKIDGEVVANASFFNLNYFNQVSPNTSPFYLLKFDDVGFIYSVGVSPGMTFESGFEVRFNENHGRTPIVICRIFYALV